MIIELQSVTESGDVKCPYCNQKHKITRWHWEQNAPVAGDWWVTCVACGKGFILQTRICVNYWGQKPE